MKKYSIVIASILLPVMAFAATYRTKSGDTVQTVATKACISTSGVSSSLLNLKVASGQNVNSVCVPTPPPTPTPTGEVRFNAYITSYTYWDNTPPGSADIALPVLHQKAGGTGTYADPITIAVGHSKATGVSVPDYPKGTIFYIPNVRRYFIVEDVCGDGSKPQNGPCHTGYPSNATAWLDMWIDGQSVSSSKATQCANALTETFLVIQNPASNYAVVPGSVITNGACTAQYGNTVITQ